MVVDASRHKGLGRGEGSGNAGRVSRAMAHPTLRHVGSASKHLDAAARSFLAWFGVRKPWRSISHCSLDLRLNSRRASISPATESKCRTQNKLAHVAYLMV